MDRFDEFKDNYEHINDWGRELLRDIASDFRKLYPREDSKLPPHIDSPE
jgi:hypothetical protein